MNTVNKLDSLQTRKELLLMKIQLERMELAAHTQVFRKEFAWVGVFKRFGGWVVQKNLGGLVSLTGVGGQFLQAGLKTYPIITTLASIALLRSRLPLRKVMGVGLGAVVFARGLSWYVRRNKS